MGLSSHFSFSSPGRVAGLCLQHIKSLWGTSQQSCGLNSGDLYRRGGKISFSHQRHAGFDILCLTAVTARIPRESLHCSGLRNRPHSHTGAALYNSARAVLCVWAKGTHWGVLERCTQGVRLMLALTHAPTVYL